MWLIGIFSFVAFVGILIGIPVWLARLPHDYFTREEDSSRSRTWIDWGLRSMGVIFKNLVGYVLILAGIAMLVLPGQGILTILVGLMMTDFPGKRKVERRLIQRPEIARSINWVRRKANRPPLEIPAKDPG